MSSFPGSPLMPGPQLPGVYAQRTATFRKITIGDEEYLPGGLIVDGNNAGDPLNSPYTYELLPGHLLGRIGQSSALGSSIFGLSTASIAAAGTTLTVSTATAAEIIRRIGTQGDLYVTGPATAGGTVNSQKMTFTAISATTGNITIAAASSAGVYDVQTITLVGVNDSNGFTITYNDQTTALITATSGLAAAIQVALRALAGDMTTVAVALASGSDNVTGSTYSITFASVGYRNLVACNIYTANITSLAVTHTTPGSALEGAAGTAEVQTYTWTVTPTGGSFNVSANGVSATANYNANNATFTANIQTALRSLGSGFAGCTVTGTVNAAFVVTFAAGGVQQIAAIDITNLTSATGYTVVRTTPGVAVTAYGFVSGSLVQPADGSQNIETFVPNGYPFRVANYDLLRQAAPLAKVPVRSIVIASNLENWPSDTSLQTYVKASLNTYGKFVFREDYQP